MTKLLCVVNSCHARDHLNKGDIEVNCTVKLCQLSECASCWYDRDPSVRRAILKRAVMPYANIIGSGRHPCSLIRDFYVRRQNIYRHITRYQTGCRENAFAIVKASGNKLTCVKSERLHRKCKKKKKKKKKRKKICLTHFRNLLYSIPLLALSGWAIVITCRPSSVCPSVHTFERPPLKPLGQYFFKIHVQPSVYKRGLKICTNGHGPLIKMEPCPYMVKTPKNLLLQNQESFKTESQYIALLTQGLPSVFKWWP